MISQNEPFPTKEEMESSWRHYLATVKPIIDLLMVEEGLSKGEALMVLELNGLTNMLERLINAAENPNLPGDDWKSDGD